MNKGLKEFLKLSIYLLVIVCLSYLCVRFVGQRTVVNGKSMESTLENGDNLIVDKISYRFTDPKRFDIVVFSVQKEDEEYFIKRIIGLPGETLYIDEEGTIWIKEKDAEDFTALSDVPGLETIDVNNRGRAANPVTLGEDEYFVMGDNRNNSTDSRSVLTVSKFNNSYLVGNVKKDRIIGKAILRIYPFDSFGKVK